MRETPEGFVPPVEAPKVSETLHTASVLERSHEAALLGESFEDAAAALETVEDFIDVRAKLYAHRFPSFYQVFEDIDSVNRSPFPDSEKEEEKSRLLDEAELRSRAFSPRVADLYRGVISELRGNAYEPKFEETRVKLADLIESGDLDVLTSTTESWEVKLNRLDTRFEGYLAGRRALDKREGNLMPDDVRKARQEKLNGQSKNPPSRRNESKPSMDEMDRLKEGERAPAFWTIFPAYGGYFREQSLSVWDARRNTWVEPSYEYHDVQMVPLSENEDKKKGRINFTVHSELHANQWVSVPSPYTHGISKVECAFPYVLQQDQNGDVVIMVQGTGIVEVKVVFAPISQKIHGPVDRAKVKVPNMPVQFSEETQQFIAKIRSSKKTKLAKAWALAAYTQQHLTYSNDSSLNAIYDSDPRGYFGSIDTHQMADCDVSNTYFAALCAQLNIATRQVVGHSVKGKNATGASEIHSGTGHAWSEVWDETTLRWERIDATPAGDPNLEEEQTKGSQQKVPGDYGKQEAKRISDEKLEALRKELAEKKEQLSYTREERELSRVTGIELKEARQIVKEIDVAEDTRLPNGKRIVDVLSRLFNAIVESRKVVVEEYDSPVRKAEGGEGIEEIVRHKIGISSGDSDPVSRERIEDEEDVEPSIGGFDLYIIGDKSGSMSSTVEGEELWKMQRRAEYLIFSSLHRFQRALERAGIPSEESLSVRTEGISFRGSGEEDIDLDKPLSPKFLPQDKVRLWHSLTDQGYSNGDVEALNYIYGQILDEQALEKKGVSMKKRLRLVVACSDGGPDSPSKVQEYAEALGKLGAVVVGIGLTETASTVPVIYNTPYSRGDIAKTIDDLPAIVAKHLVAEAIRLFPARAKESAKAVIESTIAEFRRV
ncbi:hypothetical protein EPN81_02175 [Patescibacteria group bacterium]|nr:MAG: hypothetical protein EPN81_02175 [Patescibacteria group bacterium]